MHDSPSTTQELPPDAHLLGQFIPLHYHHLMLSDKARTGAFAEAITKLVRPGHRVVELGGGTGILSFLAARQGAKVTYVELNPELFHFASATLRRNGVAESIRMVHADAATFLPAEPTDVVICEMLYSGMMREKQLNVLSQFRAEYLSTFGPPLPRFIPEVAFLAVQPVQHPFEFFGYKCPLPVFQDPATSYPETIELGDAAIYSTIDYTQHVPLQFQWRGKIRVSKGGRLTALRFITKNIVAVLMEESRTIDWHNAYLLLPLEQPMDVEIGTQLQISFEYRAGESIDTLAQTMRVEVLPDAPQVTVRPRHGLTLAE